MDVKYELAYDGDNHQIIRVQGDFSNHRDLYGIAAIVNQRAQKSILFDQSDSSIISSNMAFFLANVSVNEMSKPMGITPSSLYLERLLTMIGAKDVIPVYSSVEEALKKMDFPEEAMRFVH